MRFPTKLCSLMGQLRKVRVFDLACARQAGRRQWQKLLRAKQRLPFWIFELRGGAARRLAVRGGVLRVLPSRSELPTAELRRCVKRGGRSSAQFARGN